MAPRHIRFQRLILVYISSALALVDRAVAGLVIQVPEVVAVEAVALSLEVFTMLRHLLRI